MKQEIIFLQQIIIHPKIQQNEIQRLKQENQELRENLNRGFGITEQEWKDIEEWRDAHIQAKHGGDRYSGAIGGNLTFEFIPTSIGVIGTVKCYCGDCFQFQDL